MLGEVLHELSNVSKRYEAEASCDDIVFRSAIEVTDIEKRKNMEFVKYEEKEKYGIITIDRAAA